MNQLDPYSHDEWDEWEASQSRQLSVGVVVVGVANFVVGTLAIAAGVMVLTSGTAPLGNLMDASAGMGDAAEGAGAVKDFTANLLPLTAAITLALGVLAIVGGVGVLKHQAWARLLSILLGCVAAVLGIFGMLTMNFVGLVLYGSYAVVVLIVLFDRDYRHRFD
jgi:uncharacterized membrane protein (DUF2068 family)